MSANLHGLPGCSFRGGRGTYELWDAGQASDVPPGRRCAMDWGTLRVGQLRWRPFDDSRLRPLTGGTWPPFADDGDYVGAVALQWLLEGAGLVQFRTTSRAGLIALERLYRAFMVAQEAAGGLLPAYRLELPTGYAPKRNPTGTAFAPAFTLLGWMPRSVGVFGPRLVASPRLLTASDGPPRIATDRLFDEIDRVGDLLLPRGFDDDEEPFR